METQKLIQKLQDKINELEKRLDDLNNVTTIPYEVEGAFRKRLKPVSGYSNATNPSTISQHVNEAGGGTYDVAKVPTGFITIEVEGNLRSVPYY